MTVAIELETPANDLRGVASCLRALAAYADSCQLDSYGLALLSEIVIQKCERLEELSTKHWGDTDA